MTASTKIVLVSGAVKAKDSTGHHDYLAGCRLAASLLATDGERQRGDGPRRLARK